MDIDFSEEDFANIEAAIVAGGKIWENPLLEGVKRKIKDYNRYLQSQQCCYCRRPLANEFNMVMDIEHVLPKNSFREFMFELFNLSVSCKRCNMKIKGEKVNFISDLSAVRITPKNTDLYKLIHPNLDVYSKHIKYIVKTIDTKSIVKYQVLDSSTKGEYTYNYFLLFEIEKETLNQAQGITVGEKISEKIDASIAERIRRLLRP